MHPIERRKMELKELKEDINKTAIKLRKVDMRVGDAMDHVRACLPVLRETNQTLKAIYKRLEQLEGLDD